MKSFAFTIQKTVNYRCKKPNKKLKKKNKKRKMIEKFFKRRKLKRELCKNSASVMCPNRFSKL